MGKSKQGTALYEVLRKDNLPEQQAWARESNQGEPNKEPVAKGPLTPGSMKKRAPVVPPEPRTVPATSEAAPVERPGLATVKDGPIWRIADGKVQLALSSTGVAGVIFGLACLLLIAYAVGSKFGRQQGLDQGFLNGKQATQAAALDEIGQARAQPPTLGIFDGVGDSPVQPVEPRPAASRVRSDPMDPPAGLGWVKGYTYVVVQDFRTDAQADAQHASRFLADSGVETVVLELSGDWKYRLVTTQGFNRDDPVQRKLAGKYLSRVRKLGQTYFEAGGRYRLEGYFKKLTSQSW